MKEFIELCSCYQEVVGEAREAKEATTAVAIGAMTTLAVDINKAMVVVQLEATSTPEDGQHPTVLVWVLVAGNPGMPDGCLPSVDKVAHYFPLPKKKAKHNLIT